MVVSMVEWELLERSCYRGRLVGLPRRREGWNREWMNPYPDTGLHRREIRQMEYAVDDRTDGTSGRDEKDVGVRS